MGTPSFPKSQAPLRWGLPAGAPCPRQPCQAGTKAGSSPSSHPTPAPLHWTWASDLLQSLLQSLPHRRRHDEDLSCSTRDLFLESGRLDNGPSGLALGHRTQLPKGWGERPPAQSDHAFTRGSGSHCRRARAPGGADLHRNISVTPSTGLWPQTSTSTPERRLPLPLYCWTAC